MISDENMSSRLYHNILELKRVLQNVSKTDGWFHQWLESHRREPCWHVKSREILIDLIVPAWFKKFLLDLLDILGMKLYYM